jgi:hypothetical protein
MERDIPRRLAFAGTSPISRDYRHTAVRTRFSVWNQSADFRERIGAIGARFLPIGEWSAALTAWVRCGLQRLRCDASGGREMRLAVRSGSG